MKRITITLTTLLVCLLAHSQITAFRNTVKDGYNFWLYQPPKASSVLNDSTTVKAKTPVLIFLHGSSLCGKNLDRVRRYGCLDAVEKGMSINSIILAPQNPGGAWKPERIKNLLDWVNQNYETDTTKVYVVGMSLGGYGTMDFAGTYPEKTTAAVAMCGGTTLKDVSGLGQIPLWILHGTADRAVSIRESEKVVNALTQLGTTDLLKFERIKGKGHSALARIFYLPELYEWLFEHQKGMETGVNKEYNITSQSLRNAYTSIEKDAPKPIVIDTAKVATPETISHSISGNTKIHIVKSGDTLGAIARKYGTTVRKLCAANGISAKTTLRLRQRIKVES